MFKGNFYFIKNEYFERYSYPFLEQNKEETGNEKNELNRYGAKLGLV